MAVSRMSLYGGIRRDNLGAAIVSVALEGTILDSTGETDIVDGGKTIILILTNDTWPAVGAAFNAQRQAIIDGLDAAETEATGWNAEVRDKEVVGAVVRDSDTQVTITLTAAADYDTTAEETITMTVPASALVTSASAVVASPTFMISSGFLRNIVQDIMDTIRQEQGYPPTVIEPDFPFN